MRTFTNPSPESKCRCVTRQASSVYRELYAKAGEEINVADEGPGRREREAGLAETARHDIDTPFEPSFPEFIGIL